MRVIFKIFIKAVVIFFIIQIFLKFSFRNASIPKDLIAEDIFLGVNVAGKTTIDLRLWIIRKHDKYLEIGKNPKISYLPYLINQLRGWEDAKRDYFVCM